MGSIVAEKSIAVPAQPYTDGSSPSLSESPNVEYQEYFIMQVVRVSKVEFTNFGVKRSFLHFLLRSKIPAPPTFK
jgi:hypothetical protein